MIYVQPYEKLALIYDRVMSHVNYKLWARYISNLFQFADNPIRKIVDLSVGTAELICNLKVNKYHCIGADLSRDMLRVAQSKINNNTCSLILSDVCKIPFTNDSVDAALFLYDSVNYILDENTLNNFFQEVQRILLNGGIFIFDTVTELHCKNYYLNYNEQEFWENCGYHRHSFYNENQRCQYNNFYITIDDKTYFEKHVQKIYSINEYKKLLINNGFEVRAMFDDFTFFSPNTDSERIHFVNIKKYNRK